MYGKFKYNIWAAELAEIGSLSFKNKNVKYWLCVIDDFTKLSCVKLSNNKKCKTVLNTFIKIVNESNLNQINYGLIKEELFIIDLYENG